MDIKQFFIVNSNFLYFAFGYFIGDILHYIFIVPYVLRLQQKLKDPFVNSDSKDFSGRNHE